MSISKINFTLSMQRLFINHKLQYYPLCCYYPWMIQLTVDTRQGNLKKGKKEKS
jgi:hypothetical protein